jgi:multimeric flavodoxin WrbA
MNILAFNGSPRRSGNTALLLREFLTGAGEHGAQCEVVIAHETNLNYCRGCLRCNVLKRCSIKGDDWSDLSKKILRADIIVFASPVYFHHLSAPLKKVLDRFRSFINVQITPRGLKHTPWVTWGKKFVLLLPLGSSDDADTQPIIDLFTFLTTILGPENTLHTIIGKRLAVVNQVCMPYERLRTLYETLRLPVELAEADYQANQALLQKCGELGQHLAQSTI